MHQSFSRAGFVAVAACALLAACSGGPSWLAPGQKFAASPALQSDAAKLVVSPSQLSMLTGDSATVTATEKGYTLALTSSSKGSKTCAGIASWTPRSGKGPKLHVKVKANTAGSCAITFADRDKHTAKVTISVKPAPTATVFAYTGSAQSFKVPLGITRVTIKAAGAQGGYSDGSGGLGGGLGGSVTATIPVTPGQEVLTVLVGGIGNNPYEPYGPGGGFNGGGSGGCGCGNYGFGGPGGGASDVRRGGSALANRVIVAGGGGGGAYEGVGGGDGGGLVGSGGTGTTGYGGGGGNRDRGRGGRRGRDLSHVHPRRRRKPWAWAGAAAVPESAHDRLRLRRGRRRRRLLRRRWRRRRGGRSRWIPRQRRRRFGICRSRRNWRHLRHRHANRQRPSFNVLVEQEGPAGPSRNWLVSPVRRRLRAPFPYDSVGCRTDRRSVFFMFGGAA